MHQDIIVFHYLLYMTKKIAVPTSYYMQQHTTVISPNGVNNKRKNIQLQQYTTTEEKDKKGKIKDSINTNNKPQDKDQV